MLSAPLPGYQEWDLSSRAAPRAVVDAVVHCAALVGDWGPERDYTRVNVAGTAAVLETFAQARRFVYVSTTSVYSDGTPKVRLREDARTGDCATWYGRTKAAAESLVLRQHPDAVILRPHMVYGPGDTTLLPRVVAAARFGQLAIPGTGANLVSPTHVDNLVAAVERALGTAVRGTFNVADASPAPVGELLSTVLARVGAAVTVRYVPRSIAWGVATFLESTWPSRRAPRGPLLTRYLVAQLADEHTLDITAARDRLGYSPRWSFRDGPLAE